MQTFVADVKQAVRLFSKAPSFSLAAVLTLAWGWRQRRVFSLLHATSSLHWVHNAGRAGCHVDGRGGNHFDFSHPLDVERGGGIQRLAAYVTSTVGFSANSRSERIVAEFVTPLLPGAWRSTGRGSRPDGGGRARGSARVTVISDCSGARYSTPTWGHRSVRSPERRDVHRGGRYTARIRRDCWGTASRPVGFGFAVLSVPESSGRPGGAEYSWMNLVGRLRDGVSAAQAQDQLTAVVRQVDEVRWGTTTVCDCTPPPPGTKVSSAASIHRSTC